VKERRIVMKSRWFLWLVAALIGTALAVPPVIIAAEKEKKAAQPCAPGEMKEKKEEKKEEKKVKKAAKKEAKKEAKTEGMKEEKKEEKKKK
jgi:hypothetical protein